MRAKRSGRRLIGSVPILAGDVLGILAILLPWEHLYATTDGKPDERWFGTFGLPFPNGEVSVWQYLGVSLPFILLVACGALYLIAASSRFRPMLASLALLCALVCFLITGLAFEGLPIVMSETWPYYQDAYFHGIWAALAAGPCVALGVLALASHRLMEDPSGSVASGEK